MTSTVRPHFPELDELRRLADAARVAIDVTCLREVAHDGVTFPLLVLEMGSRASDAPVVGFFGGVHGLERVGTQVVLGFLASLVTRPQADERVERLLAGVRLVFMPLVNPHGMFRGTRSNGNGVDLMRNAPVQSRERVAFLLGGHRLSRRLPWYRGAENEMEPEARALCDVVRERLLARPFSIALDCHSGFGLRDRIWFPHAHTRAPFPRIAEAHALVAGFSEKERTHTYLFEPQSTRYLTHGDLWDFLCIERTGPDRVFLPFTLEMGSWRWVRKSPRQLWSRLGLFNPLPADRLERVRRNHLPWLYFLCDAAREYRRWLPLGDARARHERQALARWFDA